MTVWCDPAPTHVDRLIVRRTSWIPHCVHGQIGDIGPVVLTVVTEVGLSTILQEVVISFFRGNMRCVNNFYTQHQSSTEWKNVGEFVVHLINEFRFA